MPPPITITRDLAPVFTAGLVLEFMTGLGPPLAALGSDPPPPHADNKLAANPAPVAFKK